MKIFGLIGGIGSGKSTVARMFADRGVKVIDADRIGHEVLLLPDVKNEIHKNWGGAVFGADGEVDRRALAAIVFSGTEYGNRQLETLSRISHPRIGEKIKILIEKSCEKSCEKQEKSLLIDAPLLLEGGWDHFCGDILFVDAPEEVRISRVLTRGWTEKEFHNREKLQFPVEFKRSRATRLILNNGSLEALEQQIDQILSECSG